jgi:heat-inducible transcriptional repressor
MLDDRKAAILRAVVQEYIESAQPVGSQTVARAAGLKVSPATVRTEMAGLERDGYLVQPHTSAGRIPTDKGYRFFVDNITDPGPLDPGRRQQVRQFFNQAHGEIEQMLHDTTQLLSRLTDYAAVVTGPAHEAATVRSVQLVGLGGRTVLLVVVLSNGVVEKRALEMAAEPSPDRLGAATAHLASALVGAVLASLPAVPLSGDPEVDDLVTASVTALDSSRHEDEPDRVFVGGTSRMVSSFDAVESVRQVLSILEEQFVVVGLLRDVLDRGLSVAIGAEHGLEPLAECSVVVAPYAVEGQPTGRIAVLGPTRMNYPQAIAAVAVVSSRLSKKLNEG